MTYSIKVMAGTKGTRTFVFGNISLERKSAFIERDSLISKLNFSDTETFAFSQQ